MPNRKDIYNFINNEGLTSKSYSDWSAMIDTPEGRRKAYDFYKENGAVTTDYETFSKTMTESGHNYLNINGKKTQVDYSTYNDFKTRHQNDTKKDSVPASVKSIVGSANDDTATDYGMTDVRHNYMTPEQRQEDERRKYTDILMPEMTPEAKEGRRQRMIEYAGKSATPVAGQKKEEYKPYLMFNEGENMASAQQRWKDEEIWKNERAYEVKENLMPDLMPVLEAEDKEAQKRANEAILERQNMGALGIDKGMEYANSMMNLVDMERESDPAKLMERVNKVIDSDEKFGEKVSELVMRRVLGDNSQGEPVNTEEGEVESKPLTPEEQAAINQMLSNEYAGVAQEIQNQIYNYYAQQGMPKGYLQYFLQGAMMDSLTGRIAKTVIDKLAHSSGMREQMRQQMSERYGEDVGMVGRAAKGAAAMLADSPAFGIAGMPAKIVGGWIGKTALGAALRVGMEQGGKMAMGTKLAVGALHSGTTFANYDLMNAAASQWQNDRWDAGELMESWAGGMKTGAALGVMGGVTGAIAERTASDIAKYAVKAGGYAGEVGLFSGMQVYEKAKMEGKDFWDIALSGDGAEILGEQAAMIGMLKMQHLPSEIANRNREISRRGMGMTGEWREMLKERGIDFSSFWSAAKSGYEMKKGADLSEVKDMAGAFGIKLKFDDKQQSALDMYEKIMKDDTLPQNLKGYFTYLVTGKYVMPSPVMGYDILNENGTARFTTKDAEGKVIDVYTLNAEDEAEERQKLQNEIRLNNTTMLEQTAASPSTELPAAIMQMQKETDWSYNDITSAIDAVTGKNADENGIRLAPTEEQRYIYDSVIKIAKDRCAQYLKNLPQLREEVEDETGVDVSKALKKAQPKENERAAIDLYNQKLSDLLGRKTAENEARNIIGEGREKGMNAETPQEKKAIGDEVKAASPQIKPEMKAKINELWGNDDDLGVYIADIINEYGKESDEFKGVAAYVQAKEALQEVVNKANKEVQEAVSQYGEQMQEHVDRNGNVATATVNKNKVTLRDYDPDMEISYYVDPETGDIKHVKTSDLTEVQVQPYSALMDAFAQAKEKEVRDNLDGDLNHHEKTQRGMYQMRQIIDFTDADGKEKKMRIEGIDGNGNYRISYGEIGKDGMWKAERTDTMADADLKKLQDRHFEGKDKEKKMMMGEEDSQGEPVNTKEPVNTENPEEPVAETAPEEPEATEKPEEPVTEAPVAPAEEKKAVDMIPEVVDEKTGEKRKVYENASVEQTRQALIEQYGQDEDGKGIVAEIAEDMIKDAEKRREKATSPDEKAKAFRDMKYWERVRDFNRQEEEKAVAEEKIDEAKGRVDSAIQSVVNNYSREPMTFDEVDKMVKEDIAAIEDENVRKEMENYWSERMDAVYDQMGEMYWRKHLNDKYEELGSVKAALDSMSADDIEDMLLDVNADRIPWLKNNADPTSFKRTNIYRKMVERDSTDIKGIMNEVAEENHQKYLEWKAKQDAMKNGAEDGIRWRDGEEEEDTVYYTAGKNTAPNGEKYMEDNSGNTELCTIPTDVFEKMGVRPIPFRLTEGMAKHVMESRNLASLDEAVKYVLDIMNSYDHVREGRDKNTYVFSKEMGKTRAARRVIGLELQYKEGGYIGIKTAGHEAIRKIKESKILWEKGENQTSATGTVPANVTSDNPINDGKGNGFASNQSILLSEGKGSENAPYNQTNAEKIAADDEKYMNAVKNGDMETAQRMVLEKADREIDKDMQLASDDGVVGFQYHRGEAPKRTKVMFAVLNVTPEGFKAAYAGNKTGTPVGVWLDAVPLRSWESDRKKNDDGSYSRYVAGDTGASWTDMFTPERYEEMMKEDPTITKGTRWLYERGGKHGTDVPNFGQMNTRTNEAGEKVKSGKEGALPHNKLIFEIECGMDEDGDLTSYVAENGRFVKKKNQGMAWVGTNKFYFFKTNPNAVGNWGIAGTFRIKRLVPHDEIVRECEKAGVPVQKWVGGYHPEDSGLSVEMVDEMYKEGKKKKLMDAVTYDDEGNVIPLSQRFNMEKEDLRFRDDSQGEPVNTKPVKKESVNTSENGFYSPAEKAVIEVKQEKATGEQWLKMIEKAGGLKKEEDKWMGLSDWLKEQSHQQNPKPRPTKINVKGREYDVKELEDELMQELQYRINEVYGYDDAEIVGVRLVGSYMRGEEHEGSDLDLIVEYRGDAREDDLFNDINGDEDRINVNGITVDVNPITEGKSGTLDEWEKRNAGFTKKPRAITKQELLDFIRRNSVEVKEVTYADRNDGMTDEADVKEQVMNSSAWEGLMQDLTEYDENDYPYIDKEKFKQMAAEDENFRFGFSVDYWGEQIDIDDPIAAATYLGLNVDHPIHETRMAYTTDGLTDKREIALVVPSVEEYEGSLPEIHFTDKATGGKTVAWCRFGDYVDNDGKRVLVIDEIQSQRHQDGREKGYKEDYEFSAKYMYEQAKKEMNDYRRQMQEKYGQYFMEDDMTVEEQKRYTELLDRMNTASEYDSEKEKLYNVPDAPFQKNWHELAMKRMLRYAAENGYDKVAWTDGRTQAERYGIGNEVKSIYVYKADPVTGKEMDGKYYVRTYDYDDSEINSATGHMDRAKMIEIFGKDIATKLADDSDAHEKGWANIDLSSDDVKVGGEGMKGFYDQMLPRWMNKYGKKWGVKVSEEFMDGLRDGQSGYEIENENGYRGLRMWSVPVTEEMKESVIWEGQPMWRHGDGSQGEPVNTKPVNTSEKKDGKWEVDSKDTDKRHIEEAVINSGNKLNVKVNVLRKGDEKQFSEMIQTKLRRGGKGWFNPKTGEIYIYLDNATDVGDAVKTMLHEIVGHKGMRDLLGAEQYDNIMIDMYGKLPDEMKDEVDALAQKKYKGNYAVAMDEYLAGKAEEGTTPSWWGKIVGAVRNALKQVFGMDLELTDGDIKYMLWKSYKGLANERDVFSVADDIAMRLRNGIGEFKRMKDNVTSRMRDGEVTKTKNFKNWFGDWEKEPEKASKVVDEDGKPLVVYHGTNRYGFTVFDTQNGDKVDNNIGSHFGGMDAAEEFADEKQRMKITKMGIYPVYLDIKKPYETFDWFGQDDCYPFMEAIKLANKIGSDEAKKIINDIADANKDFEWMQEIRQYFNNGAPENVISSLIEEKYLESDGEGQNVLYNGIKKLLRMAGYDGIKYYNDLEGDGWCWVALDPEQVKSASVGDEMENNGEFSRKNPDIRYAEDKEADKKYMQAVKEGNESKLRDMVKQAAKRFMPDTKVVDKNGMPLEVYHGTRNGGFTEFDLGYGYEGKGVFTSDDANAVRDYSKSDRRVKLPDFKDGDLDAATNWLNDLHKDLGVTWKVEKIKDEDGDDAWILVENDGDRIIRDKQSIQYSAEDMTDYIKDQYNNNIDSVYPVYLNIKNPYILDAKGASWKEVEFDGTKRTLDSILKQLKNEGKYDGLIVNNVYDSWTTDGTITEYIAFEPEQVKITDPVTYDDRGNVIPLSERFNSEEKDMRYAGEGDKSLVGVHNISEGQLIKALKLGGLANPSTAIIDVDKQNHERYGDISLVMPSSLVDSRTGNHGGTNAADIYSPDYPQVYKRFTDKNEMKMKDKIYELAGKYAGAMNIWGNFQSNLEHGRTGGLEYVFAKMKGADVDSFYHAGFNSYWEPYMKYRDGFELRQAMNEDPELAKEITKHFYDKEVSDQFRMMRSKLQKKEGENKIEFFNRCREWAKAAADMFIDKENGQWAWRLIDDEFNSQKKAYTSNGDFDHWETRNKVSNFISENNLWDEYAKWEEEFVNQYEPKEMLYDGQDREGQSKWVENTLKNASRMMKKQGKVNTDGFFNTSMGGVRAEFAPLMKTLDEIRENKWRLDKEKFEEQRNALEEQYTELAKFFDKEDSYDWNSKYYELVDAMKSGNAKKWADKNGFNITKEDGKMIDNFAIALKEMPTEYFELKFERPVKLDEFAGAVVPKSASEQVKKALRDAGLTLFEYDPEVEGDRKRAMQEASDLEDVRFRFVGEKGLQNDEEAMKNLGDAEMMEQMKNDPEADMSLEDRKALGILDERAFKEYLDKSKRRRIKMATGWERGADGKWRYETPDFEGKIDFSGNAQVRDEAGFKRYHQLIRKSNGFAFGFNEDLAEEEKKEYAELRKQYGTSKGWQVTDLLPKFVKDDKLFEMYPEMKNVQVSFVTMDGGKKAALVEPSLNDILDGKAVLPFRIELNSRMNEEEATSAMAHEIQHGVQMLEGFARGGSLESSVSKLQEIGKKMGIQKGQKMTINDMKRYLGYIKADIYNDLLDEAMKNGYRDIEDWIDDLNPFTYYHRLSGEVEARNVQTRMGMTDKQRRETLAEDTEDVKRNKQVVDWGYPTESNLIMGEKGAESLDEFEKDRKGMLKWIEGMEKAFGRNGKENMKEERARWEQRFVDDGTKRMKSLKVAVRMAKQKKSAKDIKIATGWEQGKDNKWRYEVGDAKIQNKVYDRLDKVNDGKFDVTAKLEQVIDAPELFEAYPRLKDVSVHFYRDEDSDYGGYARGYEIWVNTKDYKKTSDNMKVGGWTQEQVDMFMDLEKEGLNETINHEIQHVIQDIEGFAQGGNTEDVRRLLENVLKGNEYNNEESKEQLTRHGELVSTLYGIKYCQQLFRNPKRFLKWQEAYRYSGSKDDIIAAGQKWAVENYWKAMDDLKYDAMRWGVDLEKYGIDVDAIEKKINNMFADGMTPEQIAKQMPFAEQVTKAYEAIVKASSKSVEANESRETVKRYKDLENTLNTVYRDYELYRRLAGEVEARAVAERLNMTHEERRQSPVAESEDVSRKDQIAVSWSGKEMMGSRNSQGEPVNTKKEEEKVKDSLKSSPYDNSLKDPQDLTTMIAPKANDGAKIRVSGENDKIIVGNLEKVRKIYDGSNRSKGFLTDLKTALGISTDKGSSGYRIFVTKDGSEFSLRLSNHNVNAENYTEHEGADENISIVIKSRRSKNTFYPHENVNAVEYVYMKEDIAKNSDILTSIVDGIKDLMQSGIYEDTTGLAKMNVSKKNVEEEGIRFRDGEEDEASRSTQMKMADRQKKSVKERGRLLMEDGALDWQDYVLISVGGGAKFKWNDTETSKGLGAHTTGRDSKEQKKAWRGIIDNKDGETPEEMAHRIWQGMPEAMKELCTDQDVMNEIIDDVRSYETHKDMLTASEKAHFDMEVESFKAEKEAALQAYAESLGYNNYEELQKAERDAYAKKQGYADYDEMMKVRMDMWAQNNGYNDYAQYMEQTNAQKDASAEIARRKAENERRYQQAAIQGKIEQAKEERFRREYIEKQAQNRWLRAKGYENMEDYYAAKRLMAEQSKKVAARQKARERRLQQLLAKSDEAESTLPEMPVREKDEKYSDWIVRFAEWKVKLDDAKKLYAKSHPVQAITRDEAMNSVSKRVDEQLKRNAVSSMDKSTLNSIMKTLKNTTPENVDEMLEEAERLVNHIQIKANEKELEKLLKLKTSDVNGKNMSIAKNVDEQTKRIMDSLEKRVLDTRTTAVDDRIHTLRSQNWHLREERRNTTDEARIREIEDAIDNNNEEIEDLTRKKVELLDEKRKQGDADVEQAISELEDKMNAAAEGSAQWTNDDTVAYTTLQLQKKIIENAKHEGERFEVENEMRNIRQQKAQLWEEYKDRLNAEKENADASGDDSSFKTLLDEYRNKRNALNNKLQGLRMIANESIKATIDGQEILLQDLKELVEGGKNGLMQKIENEQMRRISMITNALHDIRGGKKVDIYTVDKKHGKENMVKSAFTAALNSFDYLTRAIVENKSGEDGWMHQYFMYGKDGVNEAWNTYIAGKRSAEERLDAKVAEYFKDVKTGITRRKNIRTFADWQEAMDKKPKEGKWGEKNGIRMDDGEWATTGITVLDMQDVDENGQPTGKRIEWKDMTKGQATYAYMVWKMTDGRGKMLNMGFDDQSMEEVRKYIGDENAKMADWIQNELLTELREKYNERYREIYNTSMASIDNYVPLKILGAARRQEVDFSGDTGKGAGQLVAKTGSLINRTANSLPVDFSNSAAEVIWNHINEMEEFNAYARVRKDLSCIFSSNAFKNQLNTNSSGMFTRLRKAAEIATMTEQDQKVGALDNLAGKLQKPLAGSAIAFRYSTALKQILSAPAFYGYTDDPVFATMLTYNIMKDYGRNAPAIAANMLSAGIFGKKMFKQAEEATKSYKAALGADVQWCIKNLPDFWQRVSLGAAGDNRLAETFLEKGGWYSKKYMEIGMSPNKMVDAVTVAIGAKTIYDYEMMKEKGYNIGKKHVKGRMEKLEERIFDGVDATEERKEQWRKEYLKEAERMAKAKAVGCYNQSQQSNNPAYLSAQQTGKTLVDRAMSLFKNSPISYARKMYTSIQDLNKLVTRRKKMESSYMHQYLREMGVTEQTATYAQIAEAKIQSHTKMWQILRKSALNAIMFGWFTNWIWNKGGQGILGFMAEDDDDDDKDKNGLEKAADNMLEFLKYPAQGTFGMDFISNAANGTKTGLTFMSTNEYDKFMQDFNKAKEEFDLFSPEIFNLTLHAATKYSIGLDLDTWQNIYMGAERMAKSEGNIDEMTIAYMYFMNSAKSQRAAVAKNIFKEKYGENYMDHIDEYVRDVERAIGYTVDEDMFESWMPAPKALKAATESRLKREFIEKNLTAEEKKAYEEKKKFDEDLKKADLMRLSEMFKKETNETRKEAIMSRYFSLDKKEHESGDDKNMEMYNDMIGIKESSKNEVEQAWIQRMTVGEMEQESTIRRTMSEIKKEYDDYKKFCESTHDVSAIKAYKEEHPDAVRYEEMRKLKNEISKLRKEWYEHKEAGHEKIAQKKKSEAVNLQKKLMAM